MPIRHVLLAVSVAAMWGLNFLAIDASLQVFPPLFLVAVRFAVIAVPVLCFVPRPDVRLRWLLGYGMGFGVIQFAFLYAAMDAGMPAGLASLVLQASAPFTVLMGAVLLREKVGVRAGIGIVIAVLGLGVVGWHRAENASLVPFLLTLVGAAGWAFGNICTRQAGSAYPLRLVAWMSVVPPVPMLALSLLVEGPGRIAEAVTGLGSASGVLALLGLAYTVAIGTLAGSGLWSWLMARHPAGSVAPFSMLVPVVGMSAAWVLLGEQVHPVEAAGGVLVIGGVLTAVLPHRRPSPGRLRLGPEAQRRKKARSSAAIAVSRAPAADQAASTGSAGPAEPAGASEPAGTSGTGSTASR